MLKITPEPQARAYSSTAVDLHLAGTLNLWKDLNRAGMTAAIDPTDENFSFPELVKAHSKEITISESGYLFRRGDFILGWTLERIQLPHFSRIAARVEGKSSLARFGLGVHITAPTIHAGFGYNKKTQDDIGQPIQLEIFSVGTIPICLKKGMPICQLIFEEVHGTPDKGYEGMFARQGPTTK